MRRLLRRWFIDGMAFMAMVLISSLIIRLIIDKASTYIPYLQGLREIGAVAIALTEAAIGAAIAYGLKAGPLVIFSTLVVSYAAYDMGGVAGSYITRIAAIEIARHYVGMTNI